MVSQTNKIPKLHDETDYYYRLREKFIKLNKPKGKKELDKLIMFSKIFVNVALLGCRYETKIEKKLNEYSSKIRNNIKKNNVNLSLFSK